MKSVSTPLLAALAVLIGMTVGGLELRDGTPAVKRAAAAGMSSTGTINLGEFGLACKVCAYDSSTGGQKCQKIVMGGGSTDCVDWAWYVPHVGTIYSCKMNLEKRCGAGGFGQFGGGDRVMH